MQPEHVNHYRIGFWRLFLLVVLVGVIGQAIHESGHSIVLQAFRRGPVFTVNGLAQIWGTEPLHPDAWVMITTPEGDRGWLRLHSPVASHMEWYITLMAGPVMSLAIIVIGLFLAHRSGKTVLKQMALASAITTSLFMTAYYLPGLFRNSGDEYFVALYSGIPVYVFKIPLALAFITGLIMGFVMLKQWSTRLKWLGTIILGSIPVALWAILAGPWVVSQIDQGNPLFVQEVFGFSLHVFAVNALACIGLDMWWRQVRETCHESQRTAG